MVDKLTCLPYAKHEPCQLCVDACRLAGYKAIEFVRVGTEMDVEGAPIADTGLLAPVVLAEKCVGCGAVPDSLLRRQRAPRRETAAVIHSG